jgi:glycerophosphoryl diester phosphodiesterase
MNQARDKIFIAGAKKFLILFSLLVLASCQVAGKSAPPEGHKSTQTKVQVIGHRGAAGLAPENTLAAFRRACQIDVDGFELDVLLTADRHVVVHHDFRLKPEIARTPDGKWLREDSRPVVKNLKLAELKTYDVGRLKPYTGYSRRYPEQTPVDGERIPTLAEVIQLLKTECDRKTQIWVEIKTSPEKPNMTPAPEIAADAVVKAMREQKISDRSFILSFDWRVLVHIQKIAPGIPTVYLSHMGVRLNNIKPGQPGPSPWMAGFDIDDYHGLIPRAIKAAGGRYWASFYKYVTISNIQKAHQLGIQVIVWTPDSRSEMVRLIDMGVDGIITNRPDILRAVIRGSQ